MRIVCISLPAILVVREDPFKLSSLVSRHKSEKERGCKDRRAEHIEGLPRQQVFLHIVSAAKNDALLYSLGIVGVMGRNCQRVHEVLRIDRMHLKYVLLHSLSSFYKVSHRDWKLYFVFDCL